MIALIILFSVLGYLFMGYVGSVFFCRGLVRDYRKQDKKYKDWYKDHVHRCPLNLSERGHQFCGGKTEPKGDSSTAIMGIALGTLFWPLGIIGACVYFPSRQAGRAMVRLTNTLVDML